MPSSTNLYTLNAPTAARAVSAGVLAIHGSASNGKLWRPLQAALQGRRDVFAPDLDGYGAHPGQARQQDRLEQLGKILLAQTQPMDIVAHSFGGAIALKLADAFPDRVRRVSIYDPVVPVRTCDSGTDLPADLQARLSGVISADAQTVMRFFFEYWGSADAWHALDEDKRQRLFGYHASLLRDVSELMSGKWTVLRSRFNGPITVFRGTASRAATRQSCEHIVDVFEQARWIELPGLTHLAPITNPEPVIAALLDGLGDHVQAPDVPHASQSKSAA